MSWSADDSVLISCADDGSLYEWDISNRGKRLNELVIKSCSYSDVVLTSKYGDKHKMILSISESLLTTS